MSTRPSSAALLAIVVLAGFTMWITWQAKALENDLDTSTQKIALLDKRAPDFSLQSLDGHPVSLADYRGKKKVVLVFWASWNNGSHPQMLLMNVLYRNAHKPDSDFDVVAISVDDDGAAVRKFVSDAKIGFPVVLDQDRKVTDAYKIRSVPTTLLVETGGEVSYGSVGLTRGQNDMVRRLGLRPEDMRLDMRTPYGGRRGN
jgi:peroxiredoxin